MLDFFLVRHGQTHWNAERRVQGFKDSALTAAGERQADEVAAHLLKRLAGRTPLILSSDLWRAHATAQIIQARLVAAGAAAAGPLQLESWLRERGLGVAEGRIWDSLFDEMPETMRAYTDGQRDAIPSSEPWPDFQRRLREGFLNTAAVDGAHDAVVAVTHGGVIRAMQVWAGVEPDGRLPNASCWRFRFAEGAAELLD